MIRYLSEDSDKSPFVRLFNAAYGGRTMLQAVGSSSLLSKWASRYTKAGDDVIVYLDMVPDNERLTIVYESLFELIHSGQRIAILPIVCAEYAFINSVLGVKGPISSMDGLWEILSRSLEYRKSVLYTCDEHNEKWFSSFETFCKLFCARCLKRRCCAVISNSDALKESKYFLGDCECKDCQTRLTLYEKSINYLSQLHIVPSLGNGDKELTWEDVLACSYALIDDYDDWAFKYNRNHVRLPKK